MAKPAPAAIARAWSDRELPAVDERLCTACGRCVEICPTACLAMAGPLPWLPRPADCISCGACVFLCPVSALTLEPPVKQNEPGSVGIGRSGATLARVTEVNEPKLLGATLVLRGTQGDAPHHPRPGHAVLRAVHPRHRTLHARL